MSSDTTHQEIEEEARMTQAHGASVHAGTDRANRQGFDPSELTSKEFIDAITELDVERDLAKGDPAYHGIENLLSAETSRQLSLGNITRKQWEEEKMMDRARALLTKMEFSRPAGMGSECAGDTRRRITGDADDEARFLTDDLERQVDSAWEQVTLMRTGSINGERFSQLAEAHIVTEQKGWKSDSSSDGALGKISSFVGGS